MKQLFLYSLLFTVSANLALAQNIFSGEPVQVTGTMNSFTTAAAANSTYRRITTTTGNPTDGRGQWVKTYNAQPTGGDVTNTNMPGGSGGGFLFISGPPSNRFQNKWVFSGVGQAKLDTINSISAYNFGQDMGLNMATPGRYTFVFNDCGYTATNALFYVGYTQNQPVQLSGAGMQLLQNGSVQVQISTSSTPSATERVFIRYTLNNNFGTSSGSSIIQCSSINSPKDTLWQANIPAASAGSSVSYYFFTSTLSAAQLNALNETGKSLCAISVADNNGSNFQYSFVPKYNVVFRINMAAFACTPFDSITLTGNQQALGNWITSRRLKPVGSIFSDTLLLDSGNLLEYKFRYHRNGLANWEGTFSTTSGNRELRVSRDTILPAFCFDQQQACPAFIPPSQITFRVDLSRGSPDVQGRIFVMGNFTQQPWQQGALRLFPVAGKPGQYERTITTCRDTLLYKFINGDSSVIANAESFPSPAQRTCVVPASGGGFNRRFIRNDSLPAVLDFMFDSCMAAPVLPKLKIVFEVNLEKQKCALPDSVCLVGNSVFLGGWGSGRKMTRIPGTNRYIDSLQIDSGLVLQYKFRAHRNGQNIWEADFMTPSKNRELLVNGNLKAGPFCFGETANCPSGNPPSAVKFRVDLSDIIPDAQSRVFVMGNFTQPQWQGGALRMQVVSGRPGLFELTTQVCVDTIFYKFINGDSSIAANAESYPDPNQRGCLISNGLGGFNRMLVRNSTNLTEVEYLFNKCSKKEEAQISNPVPTIVCGNGIVTVQYSLRFAQYTDTIFTIEISDTSGSFTQPVNAGTVKLFNQTGQTNLAIPAPAFSGKYWIRLVSPARSIISSAMEITRRSSVSVGTISGASFVRKNAIHPYQTTLPQGSTAIWEVTGGLIQTGGGTDKITVQWMNDGLHSIKVKANDTCSNQTQLTVSVCQPVGADSIIGPRQVKPADTVTYEAANKSFSVYLWQISSNGKLISGAGTPQVKVIWQNGTSGNVSVYPPEPCVDTLSIAVNIGSTGVQQVQNHAVSIYPNPFTDKIYFSGLTNQTNVTIKGITGAIHQVVYHLEKGFIETHMLPAGVYFLNISTESGLQIFKLIKL